MKATAIVPVKRFDTAKQRLAPGVGEELRPAVVAAMLGDVLEAIATARMIERTLVVSGEQAALPIALEAGADVIDDPSDAGHSEAALLGIADAAAFGATCVALLPGDCPLLDGRELDRLLTGVPDRYVAIVPDRHGTGTNALVLSPADAIRPAFGPDSCQRHVDAAREVTIPHAVEPLASLAVDLDTPADLIALTRELEGGRGTAPRTARALGI